MDAYICRYPSTICFYTIYKIDMQYMYDIIHVFYIYIHMYRPVLCMCAACFFKAHIYIYRCTYIYIYECIYIYIHVSNLFLHTAQHKCIFMHLRIRTLRFSASELVFRDANEVSKRWRGLPWKVDGGHRRLTVGRWVSWLVGLTKCVFFSKQMHLVFFKNL